MHLTPIALALSLALTPALTAAGPSASASAAGRATPETRALAEKLAAVSDERETEAKALEPVERMLSGTIAIRLSITDAGVVAQVKHIVHDALSPVVQKAVDALVDGYAANLSGEELRRVIAFVESPEGQAEKINLPLLKNELAAAMSGSPEAAKAEDSARRAFAAASPEKRALVQRILTAQDFDAHTRRGYATLQAMMKSVTVATGVGSSIGQQRSDADAKAEDDYVRLVTGVEEGFYVTHYTDGQLEAVAAYLESEPGQAVLTRSPKVKEVVGGVVRQGLLGAVSSLPEKVCATVACTPDQRTHLAEFTTAMAAGVSRLPALTDAPS
jgi:uncharacterized protein